MSIDSRCDECNKTIDGGDNTICQYCYNVLLDKIDSLERELSELQRIIEEARDE